MRLNRGDCRLHGAAGVDDAVDHQHLPSFQLHCRRLGHPRDPVDSLPW